MRNGKSTLTKFDEEFALNKQAYADMKDQIRSNYAGQYVAIAFGRVIHASPDFDLAVKAVESLTPAPEHCIVFPADREPLFEVVESY